MCIDQTGMFSDRTTGTFIKHEWGNITEVVEDDEIIFLEPPKPEGEAMRPEEV